MACLVLLTVFKNLTFKTTLKDIFSSAMRVNKSYMGVYKIYKNILKIQNQLLSYVIVEIKSKLLLIHLNVKMIK